MEENKNLTEEELNIVSGGVAGVEGTPDTYTVVIGDNLSYTIKILYLERKMN